MLKLDKNYSDYTDETDSEYPEGKAVNASTSESFDGTPLLDSFMNNIIGAMQAMYKKAFGSTEGIDGNADTVNNSQFADAVAKYSDDRLATHADKRGENAHGATVAATPGQLAARDEYGNLQVGDAIEDEDAVNLKTAEQMFDDANIKEAAHRDVDTVVTAGSENLPTSGAVNNALKDATNRIADALDIYHQGPGYCSEGTINLPTPDFAWGSRELKYISTNQAVVTLTGLTKDAVLHQWIAIWNFGSWTSWQEVMKENSSITPTWIDVINSSDVSGMECRFPGVDAGAFYAWRNPANPNEVNLNVLAKVGAINLITVPGQTAYLNGLPIATVNNAYFFTGGQFTATAKSQNILTVTDIEITRAGYYDIDIDFITYGIGGLNYVWDFCSVFFINKSTGAIIPGDELNMQKPFMYDLNVNVPIHSSSHGIRYLAPGHYGIRADVNKAGTYSAYMWIYGRS